MASAGYGPVNGLKGNRDDEDGLVDEWGVRYEGHHKPGGGTFGRKRNNRRRYFFMAAGGIVLLIIIVIIAVAVRKHTSPPHHAHDPGMPLRFEDWKNNTNDGVTMYPRPDDGTVLIKYNFRDPGEGGYEQYVQSLEAQLHDYEMINQHGVEFAACNNKSSVPPNKVCQFELSRIKPCDKYNDFGYPSGTPCVLLQLNLPRNVTAIPFPKDSEVGKKLGSRWDPDHIGVTCDGETELDHKYMDSQTSAYPPVDYFPKEGFPAWWFRPRTIDKFLAPVVMVRFNSIQDFTNVRIKCTAWGQNFNNGKPDNSTLYSTSFVINHI